jgi:hypothetical protein
MKNLVLNNIGHKGINSDMEPWELPPEFITQGINFRVRNGAMAPFSGSVLAVDAMPGNQEAGWLLNVLVASGNYWFAGTRSSLMATDGNPWIDVSSRDYGLIVDEQYRWSGCMLGHYLVVANPSVYPEYWVTAIVQGAMLPLPFRPGESWEDVGLLCGVMRSHKNFLIALNLKGSEDSPGGYRISTAAETDGLPFTWDESDRSGIAIRAQIGSDSGEILDGLTLRDNFIIYSEDAINIITFNPNSEFYWTRRELSTTKGLLGLNCVVDIEGKHYFITRDADIVVFDGIHVQSILYNRLAKRLLANLNQDVSRSSFVVVNHRMKEVWFCVPELESTIPNVGYVYNYVDSTWSIRDLPDTLVFSDYGTLPILPEGGNQDDEIGIWDFTHSQWANIEYAWGAEKRYVTEYVLSGLTSDGEIRLIDPGGTIDETGFNTEIIRTDYPLEGHPTNNTITRIYPQASGDAFSFEIGSQQLAGGPVSWNPAIVFHPGEDRKIDSRVTGELMCWRLKSIDKNRFTLSGMTIEYVPAGRR